MPSRQGKEKMAWFDWVLKVSIALLAAVIIKARRERGRGFLEDHTNLPGERRVPS